MDRLEGAVAGQLQCLVRWLEPLDTRIARRQYLYAIFWRKNGIMDNVLVTVDFLALQMELG
jgi:hypothetical protein